MSELIKNASYGDIPEIMRVLDSAKRYMIKSGNPDQWAGAYPTVNIIKNDINAGAGHVLIGDDGRVHGYFALIFGNDPTYTLLRDGVWLNEKPYATIHRIASDGKCQGIFDTVLEFSKGKINNIRIDTHRDNAKMMALMEDHGMKRCGVIYKEDGTERIAYQGEW